MVCGKKWKMKMFYILKLLHKLKKDKITIK